MGRPSGIWMASSSRMAVSWPFISRRRYSASSGSSSSAASCTRCSKTSGLTHSDPGSLVLMTTSISGDPAILLEASAPLQSCGSGSGGMARVRRPAHPTCYNRLDPRTGKERRMAVSDLTHAGPNLQLTPEHEMIRQAAREFAQDEIAPIAAEHDESGEFPAKTIRKMGEMGFMGIEVPEDYGGAGLDTLSYVLALEEICKADAAHGTIMSVNNSLFCYGILKFGSEAQRQKFVRGVASGKSIGAYSLTEPMSGSDAGTMRTRAVQSGDQYLINGRKSWVTSAPVADFVLVFTMTEPEKGHNGITAFIIETDKPGFSRGRKEPKLGIRASATSEILFEGYRCPVDDRLGEEGEGFKIAMSVLD